MDFYKGVIPIFNTDTNKDSDNLHPSGASFGLIPRDYSVYPAEMFDIPSQMQIIPESDWDAIYDEQEAQQSSLEHLYLRGPNGGGVFENLDQNGNGYCWAYSTGHAMMLARMLQNQPLIRLNPHSVAAIIKNGADEGGWCGLSAKFVRENGIAPEGTGAGLWPLHSRNIRLDTPELRAIMAKYKSTEEWVDLNRSVYDVNMSKQQYATALMCRQPSPSDYNFWSHSVCAVRWVRISKGNWGTLILNSWKGWGRYGLGVLEGSKAVPNSMLSIRVARAF